MGGNCWQDSSAGGTRGADMCTNLLSLDNFGVLNSNVLVICDILKGSAPRVGTSCPQDTYATTCARTGH